VARLEKIFPGLKAGTVFRWGGRRRLLRGSCRAVLGALAPRVWPELRVSCGASLCTCTRGPAPHFQLQQLPVVEVAGVQGWATLNSEGAGVLGTCRRCPSTATSTNLRQQQLS
jgi:hypothetical protein